MLKRYQPHRKDFLINTDWGIPRDDLATATAKERGLVRFHGRWVTKAEKMQLSKEHQAYFTIRGMGVALIGIGLLIARDAIAFFTISIMRSAEMVLFVLALIATGIGLVRFRRAARYPAALIFIAFLVLPFTPPLENDKGAPLLLVPGVAGLYYLLRKTGRRIFWPPEAQRPHGHRSADKGRRKIGPVRIISVLTLLAALLAGGYFLYDMRQGKRLAVEACTAAKEGMPLDDFTSKLSPQDYRIVRDTNAIMVVPKRGMGRNYCRVSHDGRQITGFSTGATD